MLSKCRNGVIACFCAAGCALWFCKTPAQSLNKFANSLRSYDTKQQTCSMDLALYVLTNGYEICSAIDNLDAEIASQLGIMCDGCKTKIISGAELGGCLCALKADKQLEDFKKLLVVGDLHAIILFMQLVANEQHIDCSVCKKFVRWVELNKKILPTNASQEWQ